jgi:hypothetical protein
MAWADETLAGPGDLASSEQSTTSSDSATTDLAANLTDPAESPVTPPGPPDDPPAPPGGDSGEQQPPSDGGSGDEGGGGASADGQSAGSAASSTGDEHSSVADGQSAPQPGDAAPSIPMDASLAVIDAAVAGVGPSAPARTPDLVPIIANGFALNGIPGIDTGGTTFVPASSLRCAIACYGGTADVFRFALAPAIHEHAGRESTAPKASEPSPIPVPGAPGPTRGPFSTLLGGSSGAATGLLLLILASALGGTLARRPSFTTAFRVLTAIGPSAYVPPLESPG